jgi:uncharacterized integral membrane protein
MGIKRILMLILLGLFLVFILQNTQVVDVKFVFWRVSMSRALLLAGIFLIGLIAGWLLGRMKLRGSSNE